MQGRIQGKGGALGVPPKIGKNMEKMIFFSKICHTKYPKHFRASLRSARLFEVRPLTSNPGSAPAIKGITY